jgi:hypothetical protein
MDSLAADLATRYFIGGLLGQRIRYREIIAVLELSFLLFTKKCLEWTVIHPLRVRYQNAMRLPSDNCHQSALTRFLPK